MKCMLRLLVKPDQPEVASLIAGVCVELFENQEKNSANNPHRSQCVTSFWIFWVYVKTWAYICIKG